jgi:membrane protease subunit (stomatin/prohibitin family)
MTDLINNRWQAGDNDFAVRLELNDVEGLFRKKLTIEPGTRALFLEKGQFIGEAPPGEFTLETTLQKLAFWNKKSTVVILTRGEPVWFETAIGALPTQEMLEAEVNLRLAVQVEDVALFVKNMLGSRDRLTVPELRERLAPIIRQGLFEAAGRLSIRDLTGAQARATLETAVLQALGTSLARTGLGFGPIQALSISHPEYDAQRRRTGAIFLQRQDLEHNKQAAKLEADRLFQQIEEREKLDSLEVLSQQVAGDRMEGDLAARLRRIAIRNQWRAAIQAEEFDKIRSAEEMSRFLNQRDAERAIHKEEYETLLATLEEKSADRAALRRHLLQKLDVQQQFELDGLRLDLAFAQKKRTFEHETALADLADAAADRAWQTNLEREFSEARQRRDEESKRLEHALAAGGRRRQEELAQQRHQIEIERNQREKDAAQLDLQLRADRLKNELEEQKRREKEDRDRREGDWQIERWQKLRATKHGEATDLEKLKLERMQAQRGMSALELAAVSDQAAGVIDLAKHQATVQGQTELAKVQLSLHQSARAETADMQRRLDEANQAQVDSVNALLQQVMQAGQATLEQQGRLADSITRNLAPQPGHTVVVGGTPVQGPGPSSTGGKEARVVVCGSCRSESAAADRFCRQCGKPL